MSGLRPAEKRAAMERVRSGAAQLVVGTHALLEDPVAFARLGLVIVDEQHRFGVLQRKRLAEKGASPDVLVMTATPIPRTLSLTLYGDLDISVIDEMPPGRRPIDTRWFAPESIAGRVGISAARGRRRPPGIRRLSGDRAIEIGRGAAFAQSGHRRIRAAAEIVFPQLRVGLLHGRMRSDEKEEVMEALPARRGADSGLDHGHRGRRGRAQRHRDGDRTCRALRAVATAPAARPHWTRRREEHLYPGRAQRCAKQKARGAPAPGNHGGDPGRICHRRSRPEAARAGRVFRHAAARRRSGLHVANPLRDHELLEAARREAFALVEKPQEDEARRRLARSIPWQRRYQLASVG